MPDESQEQATGAFGVMSAAAWGVDVVADMAIKAFDFFVVTDA